jgi:hypothetical protein
VGAAGGRTVSGRSRNSGEFWRFPIILIRIEFFKNAFYAPAPGGDCFIKARVRGRKGLKIDWDILFEDHSLKLKFQVGG